ncbi:MAG: hypothetical protein ACRELG_13100, partial [Gemmataceae bacterium]
PSFVSIFTAQSIALFILGLGGLGIVSRWNNGFLISTPRLGTRMKIHVRHATSRVTGDALMKTK